MKNNKTGYTLTKAQRGRYWESFKMLVGGSQPQVGIVPPRVNLEDLGLVHEKPNQGPSCMGVDAQELLPLAETGVPHRTKRPKRPKPRKEWREQAAVVKWCKSHPLIAKDVVRIENERKRNMAQANVAKMMGLHPGATDLFISYPCNGYHGMWLEMKQDRIYTPSDRRKPSWLAQEAFIERKRKQGYAADFAFGAKHGIMLISKYLGIE